VWQGELISGDEKVASARDIGRERENCESEIASEIASESDNESESESELRLQSVLASPAHTLSDSWQQLALGEARSGRGALWAVGCGLWAVGCGLYADA
jgi:hypothetical protein